MIFLMMYSIDSFETTGKLHEVLNFYPVKLFLKLDRFIALSPCKRTFACGTIFIPFPLLKTHVKEAGAEHRSM